MNEKPNYKRRMTRIAHELSSGALLTLLLYIALVLNLSGCASPSQPVIVQPPRPPAPEPSLMSPETGGYSERARASFEMWRQRLTDSPPK